MKRMNWQITSKMMTIPLSLSSKQQQRFKSKLLLEFRNRRLQIIQKQMVVWMTLMRSWKNLTSKRTTVPTLKPKNCERMIKKKIVACFVIKNELLLIDQFENQIQFQQQQHHNYNTNSFLSSYLQNIKLILFYCSAFEFSTSISLD